MGLYISDQVQRPPGGDFCQYRVLPVHVGHGRLGILTDNFTDNTCEHLLIVIRGSHHNLVLVFVENIEKIWKMKKIVIEKNCYIKLHDNFFKFIE